MKYIKWVLGLNKGTPNCIIKAETRIVKCSEEAIIRAVAYKDVCSTSE